MFVEDHLRCSQAVLGAFAEELGLTGELGRKIAGCFGSGMGMGETCGCVTGGLMALGLRFGRSRPEDEAAREREQAVAQAFTSRFRERCGATSCRALLGPGRDRPGGTDQNQGGGIVLHPVSPVCGCRGPAGRGTVRGSVARGERRKWGGSWSGGPAAASVAGGGNAPCVFGLAAAGGSGALCPVCGRLGRTGREIGKMIADGLGKAWIVVQVLIVIGLLTASWIACGAIPYLVRLGTLLIRPHVFLVCCFWLCAAMSFLLGTSFGTANTVGVVLITIARAGGVSIPMTAGAILCGIYFGDRSSPMSSSLLLLSTLSETRLYDNVRMGLASSAIPFALASGGYLLCSYVSPLSAASGQMAEQLAGGVSPAPSGAAAHSGGVPPLRCPKAGEVGHGGPARCWPVFWR